MTTIPLLNVSEFTFSRGGRVLFENLSFAVKSGEAFVLMGPNGAGKTTLLRSLAGIPHPPSMVVKPAIQKQCYIGHLNALKAKMTVIQNLSRLTKKTDEQIQQVLSQKGLSHLVHREIQTLSAGQKRQVALARLSLSDAQLWLVDEPISHLDQEAAGQFWDELKVHLNAGGGAVLTSHTPVPINAKVINLHG